MLGRLDKRGQSPSLSSPPCASLHINQVTGGCVHYDVLVFVCPCSVEVRSGKGQREIYVAEEMRRQKQEQEQRDRGGCGLIVGVVRD